MRKKPDYMCALASYLAYQEREADINQILTSRGVSDWKHFRFDVQSNNHDHHAIVLQHKTAKVAIIAHRGTSSFAHLPTDYYISRHELPSKLIQVIKSYSERVRTCLSDYQFFETGHSMGAIFAEFNAHHFRDNCHAITFDSPGCREALSHSGLVPDDKLVTAYLAAPNGINVAATHVGHMIRLFVLYIRKGGRQLDQGLPVDIGRALKNIFGSIQAVFLPSVKEYIERQHSMANLLDCFDAQLEAPILARNILQWPNLKQFKNWILDPGHYDLFKWIDAHASLEPQTRSYNQSIEKRLKDCNVLLGGFITPDWHSMEADEKDQKRYCANAHTHFDEMFSNFEHRGYLSKQLGVHIPYQPLQAGEGENVMRENQKEVRKNIAGGAAAVGAVGGAGAAKAMGIGAAAKASVMVQAGAGQASAAASAGIGATEVAAVLGGAAAGALALGAIAYYAAGAVIDAVNADERNAVAQNDRLQQQVQDLAVERNTQQEQINRLNAAQAEMLQQMQQIQQLLGQLQNPQTPAAAPVPAPAAAAPRAAFFAPQPPIAQQQQLPAPVPQGGQPPARLH